jgi:hypothetical protein
MPVFVIHIDFSQYVCYYISLSSASASLTVYEAPGMAPMSIRASDAYQLLVYDDNGNPFVQYTLTAECARGTECGAWIGFGWVEVAPGSVATVCDQYGSCSILEADEDNEIDLSIFVGWMYSEQKTYTIKFYPSTERLYDGALYGLFVETIDAWVGYEPILPKLGTFTEPETGCTVVTPNRCKG